MIDAARLSILMLLAGLAAGCQTQAAEEHSAIITNPSPEVIEELERTISTSLYGVPVSLSESVFSTNSTLTLQPAQQNRPDVRLASSRTMTRPEQFRLVTSGDTCLLEKRSSGERFALKITRCQTVTRP